ncbi:MAG: MBL fold metallo-hydrolase [Myxococcaceae bacterium]
MDPDSLLRSLGITRIAVPIPFVDAGGPVNVYAIEERDGSYTLFDCGLGTKEAEASLRASAAELGVDLSRLKRIIVSHGHIDHYGLAQTFSEQTGATVHVHPADFAKVVGVGRWVDELPRYESYFKKLGISDEYMRMMGKAATATAKFARQVDEARARTLKAGEKFQFKHVELEVLHLPGHTPGLVCLWEPTRKILFADDHLLAKVSPNPLLEIGEGGEAQKFKSLLSYFASARRVYEMDIELVLPGHGPPFSGHRELLDGLFGFYKKRQDKIAAHLEKEPSTALELIPVVFRGIDITRLFLTLSEVVGNLEVMEEQGRVVRREVEGVYRYELAVQ